MSGPGGPAIRIEGLVKRLDEGTVLDGVDLDVARGECLVILGRSGCGKSVLLRHLVGLMKPDAGRILVNGRDIVPMDEPELMDVRRSIGVVFQGGALFDSMTVAENVGFALEREGVEEARIREVVAARLAQVDLPDVGARRPAELSGGMRKRVGIARALATAPEILLFDEPTTGLDPVTAQAIDELIAGTQRRLNVTAVVVTHDLVGAGRVGHRVVLLDGGRIRWSGAPAELASARDEVVERFVAAAGGRA